MSVALDSLFVLVQKNVQRNESVSHCENNLHKILKAKTVHTKISTD